MTRDANRWSGAPAVAASPIFCAANTPPTATVNDWTLSQNNGFWFAIRGLLGATQNSAASWTVYVPAGTYALDVFQYRGTDHGIATITLNGAAPSTFSGSADSVDQYNNPGGPHVATITGLVLPAGSYVVKFEMATKNASSTNYYGDLSGFQFRRTA